MQGQPNAIAWDLGGVDLELTGNDWTVLNGSVIWDLQNRGEYQGGGVYIPTDRGIYLTDPTFMFRQMVNVEAIQIAVFKDEDLFFVVAANSFITPGTQTISVSNSCTLDLLEGENITFRVKLFGTNPSAIVSAGAETEDPEDDLNDFTAWGLTFQHRLP